MCTVSWLGCEARGGGGGYDLFFNRDEKRARLPGHPPVVFEQDGMRFIAPLDGDRGGTWIAVNESGATCCVLNGPVTGNILRPLSRGVLPLHVVTMPGYAEIQHYLEQADFTPWAPFTVLILSPLGTALICRWDGDRRRLESTSSSMGMLTSSSFDTERVVRYRREEFEALPKSPEGMRAYHASHAAPSRAHSVCMHRPDARTVSLSTVRVGNTRVEFEYHSGAPCENQPSITIELARRA